jgi:acetylornithine deacetylase
MRRHWVPAGRRRIVRRGTGWVSTTNPGGTRPWRAGRVPPRPVAEWLTAVQPRKGGDARLLPEGTVSLRIDPDLILRDAAAILRIPSVTGEERPVLEALAELAATYGLEADLHRHDLARLRAHPGHPGEEAPRDELWGLEITLPGGPRRVCLNGHVDVVGPGTLPWRHGPWSGALEDGRLYGRGAVDMKASMVAALHALAALKGTDTPTVVLQCVASEEDGGLGTFAALERDAAFDAAFIPEPTGFDVVCAQAGALTFRGVIPGRAAHAAHRLEGCSAIDRYVRVHAALQALEREVNSDVQHPLMRELALPYPLLVGRVSGGEWSSQVPDRVEFEGRLGVPVGADPAAARAALEAAVAGALDDGEAPAELHWTGGAFLPAETAADHPWVQAVAAAIEGERGRPPRRVGVPWGADMRLFAARGIPCVMAGPSGIERAHAVDEWVAADELTTVAGVIVRLLSTAVLEGYT